MREVADEIDRSLQAVGSAEFTRVLQRFFKEEIRAYGCRMKDIERVVKEKLGNNRPDARRAWEIASQLFSLPYYEPFLAATLILERAARSLSTDDMERLEQVIAQRVSNWAECDAICQRVVRKLLSPCEEVFSILRRWAGSDSKWLRRASLVPLLGKLRDEIFFDFLMEQCETLIEDRDDMVEKAVGWSLKEASKRDMPRVAEFVRENRRRMSRTALRYAVEKFPDAERERLMSPDTRISSRRPVR